MVEYGRVASNLIFDAIEFAAKAHAGQLRKGTRFPYLIHPLGVAKILIEHNCADEIVAAGLLHDVLEDTPATVAQVRQAFGEKVAQLVEASSEPDHSDIWENRKRHTIEFLQTAPPDVLLIVLADKLDNLREIREDYARQGERTWARFNRPKEQQRWYFESLRQVFAARIDKEPGLSLLDEYGTEVTRVFENG